MSLHLVSGRLTWPLTWPLRGHLAGLLAGLVVLASPLAAQTISALPGDNTVIDAREALRKGDRNRLALLRQQLTQAGHPLAGWADYWELSSRLNQSSVEEVERFYERHSGSYVEDRLRNDWLLELGRRRDWTALARDLPRFRMQDDREVQCYGLLLDAQAGRDVKTQALRTWLAQREADDGCHLLATYLRDNGQLSAAELWAKLRLSVETGRQRPARQTAQLIGPAISAAVDALWDSPARFLTRPGTLAAVHIGPLSVLATVRMATDDPAAAALQLDAPWARALKPEWAAAAWGGVARQATLKQLPEAASWGERALRLHARATAAGAASMSGLSDDTLAWIARSQLRALGEGAQAWANLDTAIDAMTPAEQAEPVWAYWKARALLSRSRPGSGGEASLTEAQALLQAAASPLHFYGQLALEELGQAANLPPEPAALTAAEREQAQAHPGLQRALRLMALGLRGEGLREWNFTMIGLDDRRLMAAAQWACDQQVWDRCISSSERTLAQLHVAQRFPLPWPDDITSAAKQARVDPALVYGLIRQESRFVIAARSHVGASGLMQVMPATARWTAKRMGLEWRAEWRDDRAMNLRLGTSYLRMLLDDFEASLPLALAAYNAGPSRSRRWREGAILEPAAWAETIPIHETRDYVKKVLSNASLYGQRLGQQPAPSLKTLLGSAIGPRAPGAPEPNKELP